MIFDFMEAFNDNMFVLFLFVIGIACAAGGIPPIIERSRRRVGACSARRSHGGR